MSPALSDVQVFPASSIQRQFWLLQQLQPDSRAYHVASVFRIEGNLNIDALRRAFVSLVERHESLRTTFDGNEGTILQRIGKTCAIEMAVVDAAPSEEDLVAEVTEKFQLDTGPLMRVRTWRVTDGHHVLAWTMHHIAVDLASKDILAQELSLLYDGYCAGVEVELQPVDHSYAEFSEAEVGWSETEKARVAAEYFKEHLSGDKPPLALPEDHPRPIPQSHRGARVDFVLHEARGAELERGAREWQTKPFLLLMAAFALVLSKYSVAQSIVLGVPFTNRRRPEAKNVVGCFVNTLPVSVDCGESQSFRQLHEQLRRVMLGHHRHQEISLERILRVVRPPRDATRNPLYQAGFTFEHPMQVQLRGARVENLRIHPGGSQLDVFLTMWRDERSWHGHLEYCVELFEAETARRMVRSLETILESALVPEHSTTVPATALEYIHPKDKQQILNEFNHTAFDFARAELMHVLILEQATRTPDAIAVRWNDRQLTYRELQKYAQGLAKELRTEGLRDGERVGIYMPRSVEMVLAVLAVLIAGAAYVPIDPEFPRQRIDHVLEDAQPWGVLGHRSLAGQWHSHAMPLRVVDFEALTGSEQAPHSESVASSAAYVIFTSGSTGRPKGVSVSHRAICNSMLWMQQAFQLRSDDVLIQTTPYSFDVSTWELLWTFVAGAQLVIPDEGTHRDPMALAQAIEQSGVTTIHFVPSMLRVFLEQVAIGKCRSLKRVLCIGEAIGSELVKRFHSSCSVELHNLYGPTEATVQASWWFCSPDDSRAQVPIGRPIANTRFYVLDARRCPVPIGVTGELYIGGVQVAIEYVSRPELTTAAFLPDPYSDMPSARMYRTGDLARWLPDGNVEFLGRADFQVKIRGLRIELGEIEAVLEDHPSVVQCVVAARSIAGGTDTQIVAYVSSAGPPAAGLAELLRAHVGEQLPNYMVPNRFVMLDRFPLNANGKIDRRALPSVSTEPERTRASATNDLERWMSALWAELLEVGTIGVHENFFEAGGTSLMATRLMSRIRAEFGLNIPLVRLFEYPTVAQLSTFLGAAESLSSPEESNLQKARNHAAQRRLQATRAPRTRGRS